MSPEQVSIVVLALMFVVAALRPVNLGAVGFAAAFLVGTSILGLRPDDVLAGFPANLFLILVGVTYLFGIAHANGTVDLLVRTAVHLVGGRAAAIPWVMFFLTAALTAVGALSPAAVAIVAPIALGLAARHEIDTLLMGAMVVHGAQAGGFSPVSVYGGIVQGIVAKAGVLSSPMTVFVSSFIFNLLFACAVYLVYGRGLYGRRIVSSAVPSGGAVPFVATGPRASSGSMPRVRLEQVATLTALILLIVLTVGTGLDLGFTAISLAVGLAIIDPGSQQQAAGKISWSIVLLLTGVLTYVSVLQKAGAIAYLSAEVAGIGTPLMSALALCYLAGVVTAFASSTAMLGVLIPLAVPVLMAGNISAVAMIAALAISVTMPDVSPFSTNGALVVANVDSPNRDYLYQSLLRYTGLVVLLAPLAAWAIVILPAWL